MSTLIKFPRMGRLSKTCLVSLFTVFAIYSCTKEDKKGDYAIDNSLTLFKIDNKNNDVDLTANDTVSSQSGVSGKYILVSGSVGAAKGLDSIVMELYTMGDSLLNRVTLTSFFKPEYHVINTQL